MFLFISLVIAFISYLKIFFGYFQQDEWLSFAYNYSIHGGNWLAQVFAPNVGHYQPFNTLFLYIFFQVFGTNYYPYAIVSLLLHLVCVSLVYALVCLIYQNKKIAFAVSLLFGVAAASYQATFWVMADFGTHFSTIFALISLIFFVLFIKRKKSLYFYVTLLFLFISMFFKEIAIGYFVFLPILFFLFADNFLIKRRKYPLFIFGSGVIYGIFRIIMIFLPSSYANQTIAIRSQSVFQILYNVLSFPFMAFSQSIVSSQIFILIAHFIGERLPSGIVGEQGSLRFGIVTEKYILEILCFAFFFLVLYVCFRLARKMKSNGRKVIAVAFIFIFLNGFIYGFSPERTGIIADLDSRNLYFISIATSFILVWVILCFRNKYLRIVLVILLVVINVFLLQMKFESLVAEGQVRRNIISFVQNEYPIFPKKVIVYTESDSSFYGLPDSEKIMPFQSGFGQTILMLYYQKQNYPKEMIANKFLWDITEQGYRQIDGQGFGYFRDIDLVKQTIVKYGLSFDSVVAFRYDSLTMSISETTDKIRMELKNEP